MHDFFSLSVESCTTGYWDRLTDGVSPICHDRWAREGAVDELDGHFHAIRGGCSVLNVKPILSHNTRVRHMLVVVGRNIEPITPA